MIARLRPHLRDPAPQLIAQATIIAATVLGILFIGCAA
jgi:hypothetical protein